jgi:hypothetical protein
MPKSRLLVLRRSVSALRREISSRALQFQFVELAGPRSTAVLLQRVTTFVKAASADGRM